jgi:hypothetical protein
MHNQKFCSKMSAAAGLVPRNSYGMQAAEVESTANAQLTQKV